VAIRRGFLEDLYIVMPAFEVDAQSASVAVHVNPLVNWIWVGFGLMAIGTGIALLPEAAFSFALAKVPAGAVSTTALVLALLLMPTSLFAAQGETVQAVQRSEDQRRLENDIMCLCGCRAPMGTCPMRPNCPHYDEQSAKVATYLAEGQDHDAVLASFVRDYGSQAVLTAPIDKGFNRLAWAVPYALGVIALGGVFFAARRWSHPSDTASSTEAPIDPSLDDRLNDELRNLD
jgi:cytochrome c-type biogenesis protein CcmF